MIKQSAGQAGSLKIELLLSSSPEPGLLSCALPFPQSSVASLAQLSLINDNKEIDCFADVTACWPDGSVKFVSLQWWHTEAATNRYFIEVSKLHKWQKQESNLFIQDNSISLPNHTITWCPDERNLAITYKSLAHQRRSETCNSCFCLIDANKQKIDFGYQIEIKAGQTNLRNGRIATANLLLDGNNEKLFLRHRLRFNIFIDSQLIRVTSSIHNYNRAAHAQGQWDLGDANAFKFTEMALELSVTEQVASVSVTEDDWFDVENTFELQQFASGGENWQSPVHVDANQQVPMTQNGFELRIPNHIITGTRADPIVVTKQKMAFYWPKFWQNFPTSLRFADGQFKFGLISEQTGFYHELQGGEQKTHQLDILLADAPQKPSWLQAPQRLTASSEWIANSGAIPLFCENTDENHMQKLINAGIDSENNFWQKREKLDEYGWRNFGDLYADHEAAGSKIDRIFVSHYNNQYDPIMGFIRQYWLTKNNEWLELAQDLAQHVMDIDFYNTERDKAEYNLGLFWHTDHYLEAFTSGHRSYSKHQAADAYQDHAGGGGPGGQHCYTTGLVYYYWLTGNQQAKNCVLALTKWISNVYEGTGGVLELLLAVKNRHTAGTKNQLSEQYPLDRGTGNYLIALLDSYAISLDQDYLDQAEFVIRHTIHPQDDLIQRELLNVEYTWFYTVLLQAVVRYLDLKLSLDDLDTHFYYARDALLHYANWMRENECMYLTQPEKLEFPNDTWTAQDLRKATIFAAAFYFDPMRADAYRNKANEFYAGVKDKLADSGEKTYTRILALLMQNHGVTEYFLTREPTSLLPIRSDWPEASYQKSSNLTWCFLKALSKRVLNLSLKREYQWLKSRIG